MRLVYKYDIKTGITTLKLPKNRVVLDVQLQHGKPRVWVLLYAEDTDMENCNFLCIGTGQQTNEKLDRHIGTFQIYGGDEIYHVFEIAGAIH